MALTVDDTIEAKEPTSIYTLGLTQPFSAPLLMFLSVVRVQC